MNSISLNKCSLNKYFLICLSCIALMACGSNDDTVIKEPPVRPVKFLSVVSSQQSQESTLNGRAQSAIESRLSFQVNGTLQKLTVAVGDRLKKGQLIAELDSNTYQLQVQQAEATSEQAKANSQNATAIYQRTQNLYVNNSVSKTELDNAKANADSSAASLRAAMKSLELTQLDLKRTRLYSTANCQVVSINAEVNENISSGTPIVDVSCGDGIEVVVSVPESLIDRINNKTESDIQFSAVANSVYKGRVSEVGVSSTGGVTFPVTVTVEGDTNQLRSGMSAEVTFRLPGPEGTEGQDNRFYLPASVVMEDAQGTFVFLATPQADNAGLATVNRQPVATGALTKNGLQIQDGIVAGNRVITAGLSLIYDGLTVKITASH